MAGAEGERRLDLDAERVCRDAGAVVGAVHEKAAGGTGARPARLSRTQSVAATRSKRSVLAAHEPAAPAIRARIAFSSGGAAQ